MDEFIFPILLLPLLYLIRLICFIKNCFIIVEFKMYLYISQYHIKISILDGLT